jgi:hypothetical protein
MPDEIKCHCGQPLHYSDARFREIMDEITAALGQYVTVHGPDRRRWRVQRHYIALHGIKGKELATLGFEEVFATEPQRRKYSRSPKIEA